MKTRLGALVLMCPILIGVFIKVCEFFRSWGGNRYDFFVSIINWLIDEFVLILVDCDNSFQVGILVFGSCFLPLACWFLLRYFLSYFSTSCHCDVLHPFGDVDEKPMTTQHHQYIKQQVSLSKKYYLRREEFLTYECELYLKQSLAPPCHKIILTYYTSNHRLVVETRQWSTMHVSRVINYSTFALVMPL